MSLGQVCYVFNYLFILLLIGCCFFLLHIYFLFLFTFKEGDGLDLALVFVTAVCRIALWNSKDVSTVIHSAYVLLIVLQNTFDRDSLENSVTELKTDEEDVVRFSIVGEVCQSVITACS